jgi:hypothetical protein
MTSKLHILFFVKKKVPIQLYKDFYLFCKKSNRKLLFNDTVFFWSCVSIKEVRNGYKGGGGHVLFAKYNFNYPIFS